jgi:predicted nucleic-acid-binding protein
MIFIDTNYFLRFFRDDVPKQTVVVKRLFLSASKGEKKLFTSTVVFFEYFWVLGGFYDKSKDKIVKGLTNFLKLNFIHIEEREILEEALVVFKRSNLELEDCYNVVYSKSMKAKKFITFDKNRFRISNCKKRVV